MDAIKYMKEAHRMCMACKSCNDCPFKPHTTRMNCSDWAVCNPEIAVPIVEEWSEEHPLITNGQKVKEMIPDNARLTNYIDEGNVHMTIARDWWDAPYEEERDD